MNHQQKGANRIALLTGEDFQDRTRQVAKWMDKSNISVPVAEYISSTKFTIEQKNPFSGSSELAICGTDGLQFTPALSRG